jgi:serine protease
MIQTYIIHSEPVEGERQKMKSGKVKTKVIVFVICVVFLTTISGSLSNTGINTQDKHLKLVSVKGPYYDTDAPEYVPGEFLVTFKPDVSESTINAINKKYAVSVKETSSFVPEDKVLSVPVGKTVEEMVRLYESLPGVKYAQPNHIGHICMVPDDPGYDPYQWHLDNDEYGGINMESAWDISTGSGVVVAVLDTGVAYENYGPYCKAPDLAGTTFVPGYDFVNNDAHPNDDHWHGTHVAGTIAQTTNNGYGFAGVAFDCSIMPVKIANAAGSYYDNDFKDGVYYAVDHGADIISCGLGGAPSNRIREAVEYAYNNGVTVIAAAGNEYLNGNQPQYPAAYDDYVIAVGATIYNETHAYYSNTGSYLDLVAPGGDMRVDQNGDGYDDGVLQQTFLGSFCDFFSVFANGTSMATPHVSGVAALLVANGVTGPDNIRYILQSTADDLGASGRDDDYGWGLVNAYSAVHIMCGDVAPYPYDGIVDMGDVILLLNHVNHPENPDYVLFNEWAADVNYCDGNIDMGDVVLLLNNVSYPEESEYTLACCG